METGAAGACRKAALSARHHRRGSKSLTQVSRLYSRNESMTSYNLASAAIGLTVAAIILFLVRRDQLHTRYALWWIPLAIGIGLLGVFPQITDAIAPIFGISYPPILPVLLGFVLVVVKILLMDIERSRNEVKLHRLIQRVAMLEGRLLDLSGEERKID